MSPPIDAGCTLRAEQIASDEVEFHEQSGTYRTEFDFHDRPASVAVVEAVAAAADMDPVDIPPLHSIVDPDALDILFAPTTAGHVRPGGSTSFDFEGYRVTVRSHGTIEIDPLANVDDR